MMDHISLSTLLGYANSNTSQDCWGCRLQHRSGKWNISLWLREGYTILSISRMANTSSASKVSST